MGSLVDFKSYRRDDDEASDISKEDADVTTALLSQGALLGEPEVRNRFWFSKRPAQNADAIATQVNRH